MLGMLTASWLPCGLADDRKPAAEQSAVQKAEPPDELQTPVDLETARDRAKLMHRVYLSTLEVMHDRYFHDNRAVLPARALEDVFDDLEEETRIEARWISVNTPAMSVSHEPRDAFEKRAAKEISGGRAAYESIEAGEYRRAAAVPLGDGCISCHIGFSKNAPTSPRFAGLAVRVPLRSKDRDHE